MLAGMFMVKQTVGDRSFSEGSNKKKYVRKTMMHYLEETVFDVLIIIFNYVTKVSLVL